MFLKALFRFVETMLKLGRRRALVKEPDKVADIDRALAEIRKERAELDD